LSFLAAATLEAATFTAADMLDIVTFSGGQPITLSPDGAWVAYVLPDMTDEWNVLERRPVGYVYVHPLSGSPRSLSEGPERSSFPVWSPDGRKLALFLEGSDGGQLAVWDRQTGRIQKLGDRFTGRSALAPQWDGEGQRIVYAAAVEELEPEDPPRVEVVQSSDKRIPGDEYFLNKTTAVLVSVDLESGDSRPLLNEPTLVRSFQLAPGGGNLLYVAPSPETFGIIGEETNETFLLSTKGGDTPKKTGEAGTSFSWSPDGRHLLFTRDGKLLALPIEGGEASPFIESLDLPVRDPIWSPDGKWLLSLVPDESILDPEIEPPREGMYTIARPFMDLYLASASDGTARNLTASFEDQVSDPVWSPDGRAVFFRAINNQTYDETIYRYTLVEEKLTKLAGGEESYGDLSAAEGAIALTIQSATHPPDLWLIDTTNGDKERITDLNPQLTKFQFSKPELFHYHNADGVRLGALLYQPVGVGPDEKVPVITRVYEKMTPDIHRFSGRYQIFLNHGYAMLLPNVRVKVGETATSFVECVVPAVNKVRDMGFTNGKFAMWGGSFGAYATSYIITQTDIFACAVSRATPPELFRNWASGRDRDSRNIESGQARMGGSPFEVPDRYLSQSAFFHLDQVNTPVLIMHGVEDTTILFGEGEMMFYALRQLGKEATFVIYNHGDHSLSRHSRADTLDVYQRMLDWFAKYLGKETD
jgi:dipeptidyl aminopeptidase/acylaminoacyl peptidase